MSAKRKISVKKGMLLAGILSLLANPVAHAASQPHRIVDGWYAHNATLLMLGAQNDIVATVARPSMLPWMFKLFPQLSHARILPSPHLNGEELLTLSPDLVFVTRNGGSAASLRQLGLQVDEEGYDSFEGLLQSVQHTADLLGTSIAQQRVHQFSNALHLALTQAKSQVIHHRPTVVHIESIRPLQVDGSHTLINQWISAAGGVNAASGVRGNKHPVSIEQLLAWQPDIIIIGATAGDRSELKHNPLWRQLKAVQQGKVFTNPAGVFPWDRYGPEVLLQLEWARELFQQGSINEKLMIQKTQKFYKAYFDISLSTSDAGRILKGLPPQ